jgi:lipid-binding SYLF domain-containing protein
MLARVFGLPGLILAAALLAFAPPLHAQAREEARVILATQVLNELRAQRDQYIPDLLLERAYGIAVIPEVIKVGFGVGGRRGKGVMVVRDKNGRFSNPAFVTLTGGSIGWQIGAQATDVVLVFTTRSGVEGITDGKLTLGADASVAAGPVGRAASAATDMSFTAEIYSYSRNRGLFAGVALDGTGITIDRGSNAKFYGVRRVATADILEGQVTKDSETVRRFLAAVAASTVRAPAQPAATPATTQPAAAAAPDGAVSTFPAEDARPGQEPPR